ncbi:hypothetical protein PIB30_027855 [Stylosanthes scabra]|uniref:Uncharacterized protein n=1 Tax=Stylosanthes scabra TaxID=79078 RepID=A0ABU6VD03_9FABA|nr:hypothetical protein [Stylosanthes scabra]
MLQQRKPNPRNRLRKEQGKSQETIRKCRITKSKFYLDCIFLFLESNPSEVPSKTTLASEKPRTPESARTVSGHSLDVSSKSKESSNSKDKVKYSPSQSIYFMRINLDYQSVFSFRKQRASPEKERIEESVARESAPSLDIIVGEERSPCELSSEGYLISNLFKSAERSNLAMEEIDQALNNPIEKMNSPLKEREITQEEVSSTPKVHIQAGSNQGVYIDPRIQFKDKLEETRVASVEKVKQSMKHLPSIPVIELDGGDPDLAD